ncbi:MAG TPA: pyridoxal-phosphate dependent enzyme [Fimbriimonadaceae bacterium]|nr:pyridoxal-phosphate dependent enzyme [Fimbriimonadaceae bacterium]
MSDRPKLAEIRAASDRIKSVACRTPLVPFRPGEETDVRLKVETHQPMASFKIRGVYNAVATMTDEERAHGVSTVSAGNTAQALAWTARHFGVSARSVMPDHAPTNKIEAVQRLGATPVLLPMDEVFAYMKGHGWEKEPYAFVHPWTDKRVMTGHGTMGIEIIEDFPDVDSVFIPVGGGGLLGGVGSALKALKPDVRIFGVEPECCPSLYQSIQDGKPASVECKTICDGVAVPYITDEMYPLLSSLVEKVVLVSEETVRETVRTLCLVQKLIVEPAGALALAAALATPRVERGKTVCIVSGGNLDADLLTEILQ